MKPLLAVLAAIMLIGAVATATPAEANCWFNGYIWHCDGYYPYHPYWRHRPDWRHRPYWRHHDYHHHW